LNEEHGYDVYPDTNWVHVLAGFRKTAASDLPELSEPGTVLSGSRCGADSAGKRRKDQLAMFRISARTCRAFTLAEVLIMATMNVETIGPVSKRRVRSNETKRR